ncbi:MAG: hypothetical protein KDE56_29630 [Anaerolineales bacterium]|nr:hypothetical protein [Anaerolineales bacterium]
MCDNPHQPMGSFYAEIELTPRNGQRYRQRMFIWQRMLLARPHKPARSDTDG